MEGHDIQTSEEEVVYVSRKAKHPPPKKSSYDSQSK